MRITAICLIALASSLSGCTMLKWLQPHQLWKINRQPAISRDDAYFSIPADPIPDQAEVSIPQTPPF